MTVVGGNLESKEIGLVFGLSGKHTDTRVDETTGFLTLAIVDVDIFGYPVYAEEGYWESDVIDFAEKFLDYDKVFITSTNMGADTYAIQTRVSDDSVTWSEWKPIALDGTIQSDTKRYIQVKILLFAGFVTDTFAISNTDFEKNEFVEADNTGIKLKRDYKYDMSLDTAWTEEGSLHRKLITRDEWVRIDKMNVLQKV